VHLGGFIIRIYHDARSPKRQKSPRKSLMKEVLGKTDAVGTGIERMIWVVYIRQEQAKIFCSIDANFKILLFVSPTFR